MTMITSRTLFSQTQTVQRPMFLAVRSGDIRYGVVLFDDASHVKIAAEKLLGT